MYLANSLVVNDTTQYFCTKRGYLLFCINILSKITETRPFSTVICLLMPKSSLLHSCCKWVKVGKNYGPIFFTWRNFVKEGNIWMYLILFLTFNLASRCKGLALTVQMALNTVVIFKLCQIYDWKYRKFYKWTEIYNKITRYYL